jgi:hypothetical protein
MISGTLWTKLMRRIILAFLLFASACSPAMPLPTMTPAIPTLEGNVDILYPQDGSVIYSEALTISGTATTSNFALKMIGPDEKIIAQTTVQAQEDDWKVELVHSYRGEPIEVNILAVPTDADSDLDYDIATILIAPLDSRPEGVFGSITAPSDGDSVGGEVIQISGTASGLPENLLSIALIGSDGAIIDSRDITVYNPYVIDDMPWTAELTTNGYTGVAEIRISSGETTLSSINVNVTAEAG